MITVTKDFDTIPEGLNNDAQKEKLKAAISDKLLHKFDSKIYRKASIDFLKIIYNDKCAYCETNGDSGYYAEVEHYRPKKGKPIDGHSGYYWLGYEWTNLLLCCRKCNGKKLSQFPILSTRIIDPTLDVNGMPVKEFTFVNSETLLGERPLLLNPEIHKPQEHLIVLTDGTLKNITDEGECTIKTCNLNRKELVFRRKRKIKKFFDNLEMYYSEYLNLEINEEELKKNINRLYKFLFSKLTNDSEFSLVWHILAAKFEFFCKSYLQQKECEASIRYFNEYKNSLQN